MMKGGWMVWIALAAVPVAGQDVSTSATLSAEQFRAIVWIEGRWVGSGGGYDAFYEAYRFLNDSTLEQTSWPDDSFSEPEGRSTIGWREGRVLKWRDGEAQSTITRVAGDTIRFEWLETGRPGFTWIREDEDAWTAVLDQSDGEPVVYRMRRVPEGG